MNEQIDNQHSTPELWCPACKQFGCTIIGPQPPSAPPSLTLEIFLWNDDGRWYASNRPRDTAHSPRSWNKNGRVTQGIGEGGRIVVTGFSLRRVTGQLAQVVVQLSTLNAIAEKHLTKKEHPHAP